MLYRYRVRHFNRIFSVDAILTLEAIFHLHLNPSVKKEPLSLGSTYLNLGF